MEEFRVTQRRAYWLVGISRSRLSYRARPANRGVQRCFIGPGKPTQTACTESVGGQYREESLNTP